MNRGMRSLATAAVFAALSAATSTGHACACCDGYSRRMVLGWSESGNSALVRMQDAFACAPHEGLEIWIKNVPLPTGCFDMNGDPKKRIDCDQLEEAWNREVSWSDVLPSPYNYRLQYYPARPSRLDTRYVQVLGTPLPYDEEQDAFMGRTLVSVQVLSGGTWMEVLNTELNDGTPDDPSGQTAPYAPIEVAIYPSPSGEVGLLWIRGHDTMPGIGAFPEDLLWVSLPEKIGPSGKQAPPNEKAADEEDPLWGRLIYAPSPRCDAKHKPAPGSVHLNTQGFREYQKENWSGALAYFIEALEVDADYALARFNLACVLSKSGHVDRALAQLSLLGNQPCDACVKQILKAATDKDLSPLRGRPPFEALTAAATAHRDAAEK